MTEPNQMFIWILLRTGKIVEGAVVCRNNAFLECRDVHPGPGQLSLQGSDGGSDPVVRLCRTYDIFHFHAEIRRNELVRCRMSFDVGLCDQRVRNQKYQCRLLRQCDDRHGTHLAAAEGGGVEVVVLRAVAEIVKTMENRRILHRGDPEPLYALAAVVEIIRRAEDQLALAPGVASNPLSLI